MQIMTYARRIFALFLATIVFSVKRAADGAANTATTETCIGLAPGANRAKILRAYFVPDAALTADDTNFATITVSKYTAAGGSKTTLASITTAITGGSGDWTAKVPVELTLSATDANRIIAAEGAITYEIAKAGSGVQLPAGTFVVVLSDAF